MTDGHPADDGGVDICATMDILHRPQTSLLWCATLQLAWDELMGELGGPVELKHHPVDAERLNRRAADAPLPAGSSEDLPVGSFVAAAAHGDEDLADLKREIATLDPDGGPTLLPDSLDPLEWLTYAYLFRRLEWLTTFERRSHLSFQDAQVHAFGSPGEVIVRRFEDPEDFIVELPTRGLDDRALVCRMAPERTLERTVMAAIDRDARGTNGSLGRDDRFAMPCIDLDRSQSFDHLAGSLVPSPSVAAGSYISRVAQRTALTVDEVGAAVRSEAIVTLIAGLALDGRRLVFDGPFLFLLLRRGRRLPYLALWVGDAVPLVPFDRG